MRVPVLPAAPDTGARCPAPRAALAAALSWGLAAAAMAAPASPGRALAEKQGCLACHASAVKLVGPAYQEVAAKYAGDPKAKETVAAHIREGGTGRWGDAVMPPQAQLSAADAAKLAAWVLDGAK